MTLKMSTWYRSSHFRKAEATIALCARIDARWSSESLYQRDTSILAAEYFSIVHNAKRTGVTGSIHAI